MPVSRAKRLRRALRSALLRAAAAALSALPLRAALPLGAALGRLAWLLAPGTRRRALAHLAIAFPGLPAAERRRIGRESLANLGRTAMEVVAIRGYDRRLAEYVAFAGDGERLLREALAGGKGLVFVTGHVGNWELLARRIARAGVEAAVVARRTWDRRLDEWVERFRESGGLATVFREDAGAGRALLRVFREGKALGILIDQDTRVQGVFVPFFGRPAFTPRAAADLALRFGAPVLVGSCRRRGPRPSDGHLLEIAPVPFDPGAPDREAEVVRLTAACTRALEEAVRRNPTEWVWMHERWRTLPEQQASGVPKSRDLSGP